MLTLLSSALGTRGFEKVQEILESDEVLKRSEGNNPLFGRDLYYIAILGTPSEREPGMLQFGGHHLALNVTIAGERGVLTPSRRTRRRTPGPDMRGTHVAAHRDEWRPVRARVETGSANHRQSWHSRRR